MVQVVQSKRHLIKSWSADDVSSLKHSQVRPLYESRSVVYDMVDSIDVRERRDFLGDAIAAAGVRKQVVPAPFS